MNILRIALLILAGSLLAFSEDADEKFDLKKFKQDIKNSFSPLMDTMRSQQVAQLADAYASETEEMKKLVPYLIYNLLKQEIENLEKTEFEDEEMEAVRKDTLIKLIEARKKYIDYADITKLSDEIGIR